LKNKTLQEKIKLPTKFYW